MAHRKFAATRCLLLLPLPMIALRGPSLWLATQAVLPKLACQSSSISSLKSSGVIIIAPRHDLWPVHFKNAHELDRDGHIALPIIKIIGAFGQHSIANAGDMMDDDFRCLDSRLRRKLVHKGFGFSITFSA